MQPALPVPRVVVLRPVPTVLAIGVLLCCRQVLAQPVVPLSENDFLSDMPIVLSVSRLAQRQDETPGAVTILDRDMIRRSGARDVADLLRLVPGFRVSNSFESVAPQVGYHGIFGRYSNRVELLIDGRSAYSPYFIGSVAPGLQTVALQDIERMEVLRGSNSAAYGARAFLGVINIVTRHTADTLGGEGSLTMGQNGIHDAQARIGWSAGPGSIRLSADRRADDGLEGAYVSNSVSRVNLRADWYTAAGHELQLRLGALNLDSGRGQKSYPSDPLRPFRFDSAYAQLDYKVVLSSDEDLAFKLSRSQEHYREEFPVSLLSYGINDVYMVRGNGEAQSDAVSLQYTQRHSETLRSVVGGEYRSERIVSAPLYNTSAPFDTDFLRLFGNLEWRLAPDWLLNAGALAENSSVTGNTLAPRLMLNWHLAPGHTVRAGVSKAFRPPSSYEKFADVRYIVNGIPPLKNTLSTGQAEPETLLAKELGYLGDFPDWRLGLDVRLFQERFDKLIYIQTKPSPSDYRNDAAFDLRGLEYQLKLQPWQGGQVVFGQTYIDNTYATGRENLTHASTATSKRTSSLALFQQLPGQWNLTLLHTDNSPVKLVADRPQPQRRTDLRLAKALRWGAQRGELALVVQNLGSAYADFKRDYLFQQQAYITLRLEN
ncbi:TonB-dependent receptor plug domain-containing protein [Rhodoferax antarcticus]|uniref:TonB-dependent receptor plug domain-containing protein n=1 Tax=Rhodoferax antarcticus TaxID=81479 RepID=UPI0022242572|nr:TonB-dependent receptor [Rhodoferax antarcticus]MCW2311705.1 iron complex outermembrane receptor protein [Rhodoferax antarcticus]